MPGQARVVFCSTVLVSRVGFLVVVKMWGVSSGYHPPYFSFPGQPLPMNPATTHKPWPGAGLRVAGVYPGPSCDVLMFTSPPTEGKQCPLHPAQGAFVGSLLLCPDFVTAS